MGCGCKKNKNVVSKNPSGGKQTIIITSGNQQKRCDANDTECLKSAMKSTNTSATTSSKDRIIQKILAQKRAAAIAKQKNGS